VSTEASSETPVTGGEDSGESETPSTEPEPTTVADAEPTEGVEPEAEDPDELTPEHPLPGEEISESPLDELSEVAPEAEPEEHVAPVAPVPPVFDIPMVTNDKVAFWLDYYGNRRHDTFKAGLVRSGRYMHVFRRIFEEEGIPLDLIYMAHVESAYKTTAYSKAHARGIFQFIAGTGKRYGLRIDYWVDDRLDPEKSARAAAHYLKDLYAEFGDWYLAMAAYNAGEGKIRRAIANTGKKDFWSIANTRHIRRETKNYVPAILAAVMITKEPAKYGFEFEHDAPVLYETVDIEGAADLQVLARCAGTDLETMKLLNPALRRYQTPPHATTSVRVPVGSSTVVLAELEKVPVDQRVLYVRHHVKSGDTLGVIARRHGVTVSAIQQANKMGRRTMIRVGENLIIPTVAAGSYPAAAEAEAIAGVTSGEPVPYRVRRGDTLTTIARRYHTSAQAIAATSGISVRSVLRVGQRLTVVPGVSSISEAQRIAGGEAEPAPTGEAVVHVVRRGESLSAIARRYGTTPQAIASANGISVNKLLQIGDRLRVTPSGTSASNAVAAADVVHVVSSGDTLTDIAHRYGTTPGALASANSIGLNAVLRPGDRLAVVGVGSNAGTGTGAGPVVHTVRRGESLTRIARMYDTSVDALCALNRITRATTIHPGTRLTIRAD
jgi:membrane-bound lytic murein transglycosylase D